MNSFEEWINQIEIIDHNEHFLVLYKPEGLSFYEDSPKPEKKEEEMRNRKDKK